MAAKNYGLGNYMLREEDKRMQDLFAIVVSAKHEGKSLKEIIAMYEHEYNPAEITKAYNYLEPQKPSPNLKSNKIIEDEER